MSQTPPPFDPMLFATTGRVLVEKGSLIQTGNPMLLSHPFELAPQNDSALRAHIRAAYSVPDPYYFSDAARSGPISAFSEVIPPSKEAERAAIAEATEAYLKKMSVGNAAAEPATENKPFAGAVAERLAHHTLGALQADKLKNGIGLYLLLDQAIRAKYPAGITNFFANPGQGRADQYLAHLEAYTGIHPDAFLKAAKAGGLEQAGNLLALDPAYVAEVKALTDRLPRYEFSSNAVENWQVGRALPGMAHAGIDEKIAAGLEPRIDAKVKELRTAAAGRYAPPAEVSAIEANVAAGLRLVPNELSELYYRRGGRIVYTPNPSLQTLLGVGALGLNMHAKAHGDDTGGVRHLYVSAVQGPESAAGVIVHEINHEMEPGQLGKADIERVDRLAMSDSGRLRTLLPLLTEWRSADATRRTELFRQIDQGYSVSGGKPLYELFPNGDLTTLANLAGEAESKLTFDSNWFQKSPYPEQTSRFEEINARYADLRYVRLREQPDLARWIVPGLTEAHEQVYLPHIRRALDELRIQQGAAPLQPSAPQAANDNPAGDNRPTPQIATAGSNVARVAMQDQSIAFS